jgi:hypothetical protein
VQEKQSDRSSNQRKFIVSRYEFEQHILKENETTEVDTSNTEGDPGSNQA